MAVGKCRQPNAHESLWLGMRHGVPVKSLDARPEWALPSDLQPVANQILQQVLAGSSVRLSPEEESVLRARYIHQSSHWTATKGLMLAKPAPGNRRTVFPDKPQKGYPQ